MHCFLQTIGLHEHDLRYRVVLYHYISEVLLRLTFAWNCAYGIPREQRANVLGDFAEPSACCQW